PWACGELPQTPSSGISPIMLIPQESRHFQDLLTVVWDNGNISLLGLRFMHQPVYNMVIE
ncbi:hypothetical protein, partial [Halobacillus sp. BBL2006]|uniref:hypothetical protein n=1 Tax=Halobacillus sp. BBL2006 TaxID=1543706 RepID=UPI001E37002A